MKPNAMKNIVRRQPAPGLRGFTLIELLTVIAIIGVLAGFMLSVVGRVTRNKYISAATSEMAWIQTGLERYKAQYGVYPPSNPNNLLVNPLYYELQGVTNVITAGGATNITTLDGMNFVSAVSVNNMFGVAGFVNCSHGTGEDAVLAKNFLPNLKANQWALTNGAAVLVTSVGGPDVSYQPLGVPNCNTWRYNSANPTNNPGSYDLYIQLVIGGKTNLICNWSKAVQINNPLK